MTSIKKLVCSFFAATILMTIWAVKPSFAGGPLAFGSNGQPIRWIRTEFKGGPLNSTSVDAQGRVIYHVDTGPLGSLSNAEATALVDRIFKLYNDIPTSSIKFVNGGSVLNPNTKQP